MIGFEVEGLILIVGAVLVISRHAGFEPGTPAKVGFVIGAVALQAVLPVLGHATMVKVLRWMILPFVALYLALLILSWTHINTGVRPATPATWQLWTAGLRSLGLAGQSAEMTTRATSPKTPRQRESSVGFSSPRHFRKSC